MKSHIHYLAFVLFVLILSACRKNESNSDNYLDKPNCISSFVPKTYACQVVGFYPSWQRDAMPLQTIPWDKLTRIIYAFAIPDIDGTINKSDLVNTSQLVDSAHAHGVEVYFSIGGGDGSHNFPLLATNEKTRKKFIMEVRQYIFENCLDGVDIDWEYWTGYSNNVVVSAESNALVTLLKDLKKELAPFNLGISIDLGASDWGGKHFLNEIPDYVDHLQVMCYDFTGTWTAPGPHSSFKDAIGSGNTVNSTGLAYWVNYRGWPKQKVLLGVPFYGKDFDQGGGESLSYAYIIQQHPAAYKSDSVNNIYYDGINTMAEKTQYVVDNQFSGIMIWEITQDAPADSISLLNSIYRVLHP
ncbi:MAG: glycoside hydrolase family 18 protein [Bacteroidota bacterium]